MELKKIWAIMDYICGKRLAGILPEVISVLEHHHEIALSSAVREKLRSISAASIPAIANERLTLNRAGQAVLTLKTPYRDGTTHILMSPLEFMQRLATLVPRPRLHLIRFHGVLAPNAKLCAEIIPNAPLSH